MKLSTKAAFSAALSLGLVVSSPGEAQSCSALLRKAALLAVSPVTEIPDYPLRVVTRLHRFINGGFFHTSHRGVLRYLIHLRLGGYDFTNRKVLDVGSNINFFVPTVNLLYGRTGTRVTGIDSPVENLPYEGRSFDLTISNWMVPYLWDSGHEYNMLQDSIRVTKPGGQFHFTISSTQDSKAQLEWLKKHPRVQSAKRGWVFPLTPFTSPIMVKLKDADSDPWNNFEVTKKEKTRVLQGHSALKDKVEAMAWFLEENRDEIFQAMSLMSNQERNAVLKNLMERPSHRERASEITKALVKKLETIPNWKKEEGALQLLLTHLRSSNDYPKEILEVLTSHFSEFELDPIAKKELEVSLAVAAKKWATNEELSHLLKILPRVSGMDVLPAFENMILKARYNDARVVQSQMKRLKDAFPQSASTLHQKLYEKVFVVVDTGVAGDRYSKSFETSRLDPSLE